MKQILNITLIMLLLVNETRGQLTPWVLSGNIPSSTDFFGSTNAQDLNLKTEQPQNIKFFTNAGSGTFANLRMSILGTGEVGIGNFTPAYKLDVDGGDINVNHPYLGYRLDGKYVIRYSGDTTCIYVGVGAGHSSALPNSTFVGAYAGNSNGGPQNTFIGHSAGQSNTSGGRNTIICES